MIMTDNRTVAIIARRSFLLNALIRKPPSQRRWDSFKSYLVESVMYQSVGRKPSNVLRAAAVTRYDKVGDRNLENGPWGRLFPGARRHLLPRLFPRLP